MDLTLDLVTQSLLASVLIVIIIIINSYCCWTALSVCVGICSEQCAFCAPWRRTSCLEKKIYNVLYVSGEQCEHTVHIGRHSMSSLHSTPFMDRKNGNGIFCTALKTFRRPLTFFQFHPRFIIISKEIFSVSLPHSRRSIASETRTTTASTIFSHFRCFRILLFFSFVRLGIQQSFGFAHQTPSPPYANVEGS